MRRRSPSPPAKWNLDDFRRLSSQQPKEFIMRILAVAALVTLMSGGAFAQTAPSTADAPAPSGQNPTSDPKQSSPGATGAMENSAGSVATSPQEVREQSKGGAAETDKGKGSPKTIGATPGADAAQPQPK
jgi:hypothetical protein